MLQFIKKPLEHSNFFYAVVSDIEIYMEALITVDIAQEQAKLKEQIEAKKAYLRILDNKLINADFIRNAPEKVVRLEQEKKQLAEEHLAKLLAKYDQL